MTPQTPSVLLVCLDYLAVGCLAGSGVLAAARGGRGLATIVLWSAAAGLCGGALRDLLIGAPVSFVEDPGYLAVCIALAGGVWALGRGPGPARWILWLDAGGLAAYAAGGAAKAADVGAPPLVAAGIGVLTAVIGSGARRLLSDGLEGPLGRESHVCAAALGAGGLVILRLMGMSELPASGAAIAGALLLRSAALRRSDAPQTL